MFRPALLLSFRCAFWWPLSAFDVTNFLLQKGHGKSLAPTKTLPQLALLPEEERGGELGPSVSDRRTT